VLDLFNPQIPIRVASAFPVRAFGVRTEKAHGKQMQVYIGEAKCELPTCPWANPTDNMLQLGMVARCPGAEGQRCHTSSSLTLQRLHHNRHLQGPGGHSRCTMMHLCVHQWKKKCAFCRVWLGVKEMFSTCFCWHAQRGLTQSAESFSAPAVMETCWI